MGILRENPLKSFGRRQPMGDLRARDVTQSGGPINGEYCSVDQWEPLKAVTSRNREDQSTLSTAPSTNGSG